MMLYSCLYDMKTGSTTIQCGLQKHQNLLKQDNFYYIGKPCYLTNDNVLPIHFLPRELNGAYRQKPQLPKFEEIVSEHIEQGHNMIISSESFAHDDPSYWFTEKSSNRLQSLFPGYHIQVVVVYRRLSSFVTSRYPNAFNEYAKGTGKSVLRDSWPTTNKTTSSDYMEDYARLPTISSYMQSIMSVAPEAFAYDSYIVYRYEDWMQRHPSVQAYRHIKQFFNVTILNMHISGDYFTNFLCLIPSLSQSCALFKRNNEHIVKNVKGDNEIDILDVNRLAVALFDKGLIKASTNCTRTHMIKLLEGYKISDDNERKTIWSLLDGGPKICPSQFLVRRLVNLTLAIESYLCPDWYKSHDGIISRKEFLGEMLDETSTKRSKYCNFDVEEIISRDVSRWEDIVETVTNF